MVIFSLFRNRGMLVNQYIHLINSLEWPEKFHVVCVENDSHDLTREVLETWASQKHPKYDVHVVGETTGRPFYGSIVLQDRFDILSEAANIGLDKSLELDQDYIMFIESDIIFDSDLALELKKRIDILDAIVAPMVWTIRDKIFYDFWGFRTLDGEFYPTCKFGEQGEGHHEVLSAGTCLFFKPEHAGRFGKEAIVDFCKTSPAKIFALRGMHVYHPQ